MDNCLPTALMSLTLRVVDQIACLKAFFKALVTVHWSLETGKSALLGALHNIVIGLLILSCLWTNRFQR